MSRQGEGTMEGWIGARIFEVRLACGSGPRKPLSLRAFAERLNARPEARKVYDSGKLSLLERDQQRADLDDIAVIAAVDPLRRGRAWLAGWEDELRAVRAARPGTARPVPRPETGGAARAGAKRGHRSA